MKEEMETGGDVFMEMDNRNTFETTVPGPVNSGVPGNSPERGPKWVVARTVLGILSIILFVMVAFQSCAAGLGNALSDNGEVGGSAGFMCAINLLVAGLIVLVARKTVKKAPMIVAAVLMYLNLLYSQVMAGSYKDLVIWGFLSFAFGVVYLFSVLHTKKQFIIAGVITVVYLFLMIAAGSGSGSSESQSENKGAAAEETAVEESADAENQDDPADAEKEDKTEEPDAQEETVEKAAAEETEAEKTEESDETGDSDAAAENNKETTNENSVQGAAWETGEGKVLVSEDSIGSVWAQIAVPVENTGSVNLYLESGTMDLEDADGHLVESLSMVSVYPQVLKPGETGWYFEESTLDEKPSSDLKVVPHVDVEEATVDCIRYETSDVTISDEEYGGIKVTGRVENTTDEDGSMVEVVVFLYDENGDFIGNIYTYLDGDLAAGDKIGFSASSFADVADLTAADVADYKVYAYPTQFQF